MKLRRDFLFMLMVLLLAAPLAAYADDAVDDGYADSPDLMTEEPSFNNAAQAMRAANLAGIKAGEENEVTADAVEALGLAEKELADAKDVAASDPDFDLEPYEQQVRDAESALVTAIEELAGVYRQEIMAMRQEQHMGWGRIAHELGIEPAALGLGKEKFKDKQKHGRADVADPEDDVDTDLEIAEATMRDTETGWEKGHGSKTGKGKSDDHGVSLSSASNASKAEVSGKDNRGGNGSSSNRGNSSNNGKSDSSSSSSNKSNNSSEKSNNGQGNSSSSDKSNNGKSDAASGKSDNRGNSSSSEKSNNGQGNGNGKGL